MFSENNTDNNFQPTVTKVTRDKRRINRNVRYFYFIFFVYIRLYTYIMRNIENISFRINIHIYKKKQEKMNL
jgi:hypothetical protein